MALRRIGLILLLFAFVQDAYSQTAQMNNTTNIAPKQYAGKTAEEWVSDVIQIAITVRETEEEYEQSLKECARLGKTGQDKELPCTRANRAFHASQSARQEYQRLLNTVSRTSLSQPWLKAHFAWVRFGPEWKEQP